MQTIETEILYRPESAALRFLPEGPYHLPDGRMSWVGIQTGGVWRENFDRVQARKSSSSNTPAIMLVRPRKRICPSLMRVARSNRLRQAVGLKNGSKPSTTSINAKAASRKFHKIVGLRQSQSPSLLR